MKKVKKEERKICAFCGTKRFLDKMYFMNHKNGGNWGCKNNDLCVLKMSYKKKEKKLKASDLFY